MGICEVLSKKHHRGCFSLKSYTTACEASMKIWIAVDEEALKATGNVCRVWLSEKALKTGKGQLKFTFRFQTQLYTTSLGIRILKIVPLHDRSKHDAVDCQIHVSQRDFRTLEEINSTFIPKVEKVLQDIARHEAFATTMDIVKQKLDQFALAIYSDPKGFILFKQRSGSSRPEYVQLRIRPVAIELCLPHHRSLFPTFSSERHSVTCLQEALIEFTRLNWSIVRRCQFGIDWMKDGSKAQPRLESARIEHQWEEDDNTQPRDVFEPFLDDTVQNYDTICSRESKSTQEEQYNTESVTCLVFQAAQISDQDNVHIYLAIEKAIVAALSCFESAVDSFVEALTAVIRDRGTESLCVYKMLVSTMDMPSVKKAVLQKGLLSVLLEQYESMTQMIELSTTRDSRNSSDTTEGHMEVSRVECFTFPHLESIQCAYDGTHDTTPYENRPPITGIAGNPFVLTQSSEETPDSTSSTERMESCLAQGAQCDGHCRGRNLHQDIPKLTFYWLSQHDNLRTTHSGATARTLSLPEGCSFGQEEEVRNAAAANLPQRVLPSMHVTLTVGTNSSHSCSPSTETVIEHTLHAWGVQVDDTSLEDPDIPVIFAIKCTILEILCGFSPLNMDPEILKSCRNTRDAKFIQKEWAKDGILSPADLALVELMAPCWQVFPGEGPSIRWGPSRRGSQVAFAVLHEFACRPLQVHEAPTRRVHNMKLFLPQDLDTECYLQLLAGAKENLEKIFQSDNIDSFVVEETMSIVDLLTEFVASSPSVAQAQLVAFSCLKDFSPIKASIFKEKSIDRWPVAVLRLFHSLLRLFRCMLEKAKETVLQQVLLHTLLQMNPWVRLVKEYSNFVLFSDKLEKTYEPEEVACLRLGVWSYYTAIVKVARRHRDGDGQEHDSFNAFDQRKTSFAPENIPQDFKDSKPKPFGHDPLDFLRYLILPGEGYAPKVLKQQDWGLSQKGPPLEGGIHAQVLLFLKTLFSIPNNAFLKEREITTFYLELHWSGFKENYVQVSSSLNVKARVLCRLHLEVIRVIMAHHDVEIFSHVLRLGIMDGLADEIALEAANSVSFGAFNPPPSKLGPQWSKGIEMHLRIDQASTSNANGIHNLKMSDLSTDADSGWLSSVEFASSEGLVTRELSQTMEPGSKGSQESWSQALMKSISFGKQCVAHAPELEPEQETPHWSPPSTSKQSSKKHVLGNRFRAFKERMLRSEELPSRIPVFKNLPSSKKPQREKGRSNSLFSFQRKSEANSSEQDHHFRPLFETRIPKPPANDTLTLLESGEVQASECTPSESSRGKNGLHRRLGSLFGRAKSSSPFSASTSSAFSGNVTSAPRKFANKLKAKSCKGFLPGLSPSAEMKPIKISTLRQTSNAASTHSAANIENDLPTHVGRKVGVGMKATISYSPTTLHAAHLSIDDEVFSPDSDFGFSISRDRLQPKRLLNVPLLNLTGLQTPLGNRTIQLSESCLSSRHRSQIHCRDATTANSSAFHGIHCALESEETDPVTPSLDRPPQTISIQSSLDDNLNVDDSDAFGPPTFNIYCGARVDKRPSQCSEIETRETTDGEGLEFKSVEEGRSVLTCTSDTSLSDGRDIPRFETPSDFEYTGDVEEDCRRLEVLEKQFYGLTTDSDISSEGQMEQDIPYPIRPVRVPSLKMGLHLPPLEQGTSDYSLSFKNDPNGKASIDDFVPSHPKFQVPKLPCQADGQSWIHEADADSPECSKPPPLNLKQLRSNGEQGNNHPSPYLQSESSCCADWLCSRPSGFRTPPDFEYTGDLDEDVKNLERLERAYYGESTTSMSNTDCDEAESFDRDRFPSQCEQPVLRLDVDRLQPSSSSKTISLPKLNLSTRVELPKHSSDDSSCSWLQLSAKESVGESEYEMLLNGPSEKPEPLSPYETAKSERHVYSDTDLRSVWVELLLEGMLLEYNTRPARDHDTHLPHIHQIIDFVPKVLLYHLENEISRPVITQLNQRLHLRAPNLYRLLRLLSSSLFPSELYTNRDHIARGAFAHVFRCRLPLNEGNEYCAVKVMDHPVDHNEMSTLMDVYSEVSIMEQFKAEPRISHMYDYGVSSGNVYVIMKDYKCSLLDWRKRFPRDCPEAWRLFLRVFRDVLDAVKILHEKNVVHFDLKCSNILLEPLPGVSEEHFWNPPTENPPFRVVLADFGEARSYSNDWEARTVRNRGTEFNKSPEMLLIAKAQHRDHPEFDRRKRIGAGPPSDVWALGCLLFELITGEFLQFDADWSRFFLRVTTNTMSVIDKEKRKMLEYNGQSPIADLLESFLVRIHLWRPNLTTLGQKLNEILISEELPLYIQPFFPIPPARTIRNADRPSAVGLLGTVYLPREDVISLSHSLQVARMECLSNPWILSENDISFVVYVKGVNRSPCSPLNLHSMAARTNIELLEITLGDEEAVQDAHVEPIMTNVTSRRRICFTCEDGFESDLYELIVKTYRHLHPYATQFESLMNFRRHLKLL